MRVFRITVRLNKGFSGVPVLLTGESDIRQFVDLCKLRPLAKAIHKLQPIDFQTIKDSKMNEKQQVPARTLVKLSMGESYKLMTWLSTQTFQPTDDCVKLAKRAAQETGIDRIKASHVSFRMEEMGLKIPAPKGKIDTNVAIIILASAVEELYVKFGIELSKGFEDLLKQL